MERGIDKVVSQFTQRGFKIVAFNGDNEFETLREHLSPTPLNVVARGEHMGPIERSVRTIKERVRCSCQSLPYKKITRLMTWSIVESSFTKLNVFPAKEGALKTMSPSDIVLGSPKPDYNKLKITFGAYAQVYESTTNTTKSRSIGAVALKPSNERGGYYSMSLSTGRRLHCYQWTELPVSDYVIDRVEEMVTKEKQPVMTNGHPIVEWRPGIPVLDEDEVEGKDHEDDAVENGAIYDDDSGDDESNHEEHDDESLHDIQSDDSAVDDAVGAAYATDDDVDTVNDVDEINDDDHDNDPNGVNNGNDDVTVDTNDIGTGTNTKLPPPTTHQRQEPRSDGWPSQSHEATKR
jgi:hypothetical protein